MIDVTDLSVSFGTTPAVQGLSFSVARGEVLGLIGESGSGKSATALAVMGLLPPTASTTGSIRLDGEELTTAGEKRLTALRGRAMAIVFQDPLQAFTPVHRVGAQIAEAIRAHQRVPRKVAARRAVELLDLVGIRDPHQRARSYPHEFSGGMRQRALIAMAVANRPDLLIADEPTTALDVTVQAHILDVLKTAQRETGAALLLITHDLSVVARAADRVHVLRGGLTVETGTVEEVLRAPRETYTKTLIAAMEAGDRPAAARPVRTVLEVRDLVRHHPGVRAVDGVSFDLRSGETLGLVGESGSGKTTLLMEIMALARPQRGRITVLGRDTAQLSRRDRRRVRRDLQIVFQDPSASLDPRMTVGAIVAEPLLTHGRSPGRVPELLAQVGLPAAYAARHPVHLSGGQRQRVAIARAIALDPAVLVLDEPVSALDPTIRAEIVGLLENLRAERGLSYLFVAHDLPLIRRIADRVAVMYRGRIAEIGPAHQVFTAPGHPYTRALLRASALRDDDPPIATGCRFRPRCPLYAELPAAPRSRCVTEEPEISGDSGAACHHHPGEAP
ncbi:ABC transporter ATP-binding protein [Herbidospora galbida]|uniref:ABC transporter ATP-binding protein n=1 Tax=Herbidospora galbida TaxID=2575442 RepID=A0A4U3MEC5_9ACTN|nr:ABC transporter ATP-binding protein [Herbidospora galbida]TKK87100.1 ABC transporter ATP-binding protein [Herbidospora galbida]